MAIAEELQIIVDAKVTQAVRDLKKVDKSIDQTSKTSNKLKEAFKAMAGPVALGAVIAGVIKLGKESEKSFQVQEKAVLGVNAALKATGQFTEEASQDIQDYASELQELTTVGDETTLSLIQTAINMGLTADEAKEAAKQAIGMSEAFGVGLDTSLRGAANATLGNFDALTRYLPALKTASTEAEKAAIVQKQLGDAFAIAESNALSASGVQKQLENSYGDLQETIGSVISLALTPYRANLKKEVESVNLSIQAHLLRKKAVEGNATLVENLTLRQIEQQKAEEKLAQAISNVDAAENQVLDTRYLSAVQIEQITKGKEDGINTAEKLVETLTTELEAAKRATEAIARQVAEEKAMTIANIELAQGIIIVNDATDENTEATDKNTDAALTSFEAIKKEADAYNNLYGNLNELLSLQYEYEESVEKLEVDMVSLANTTQGIALRSISSLTEELAKGELSFDSFAKVALDGISQVLNALGEELLAIASVKTAASLFGPIGAATALIGAAAAFGAAGLIKGAAGSFEQGGVVPGNSFSGDNMIANVNSGEEILTMDDPRHRYNQGAFGGQDRVTIVIDGDPFDARIQKGFDNGKYRIPRRLLVT